MRTSRRQILTTLVGMSFVILNHSATLAAPTDVAKELGSLRSKYSHSAYLSLRKAVIGDDVGAGEAQQVVVDQALADFQNESIHIKLKQLRLESPADAAVMALEIYLARIRSRTRPSAVIAVGRVVVDDGVITARAVQGQMQVTEHGYFAGPLGDVKKPIGFALQGYVPVIASAKKVQGNLAWLGDLHLKRDDPTVRRSLRGNMKILGNITPSQVSAGVCLIPPEVNTPSNGYAGLAPRGEALPEISISKNGAVSAEGFSPTKYSLSFSAPGYKMRGFELDFSDSPTCDLGTVSMVSSDIDYYATNPAPPAHPIQWQESYADAKRVASDFNKPLLVMLTAKWCVRSKQLEEQTLVDPWIEKLLAPFVVVKSWEGRELEQGLLGNRGIYPTMAFIGRDGKPAHYIRGYKGPIFFAQECASAYEKLDMRIPDEIRRVLTEFEQTVDDDVSQR